MEDAAVDQDSEIARAKWLLIAGLVFIVSLFIVYQELAYLVNGRDAVATVEKTYEASRGRFGGRVRGWATWVRTF